MSNKRFEEQLAALDQLRHSGDSKAAAADLRRALQNRNNYIVAKAAQVTAQLGLNQLIPDLLAAVDRFFVDPVKSDPQCWAKAAAIQALAELGHDHPAVYVRGLRHFQMEASWGGRQDSAGPLRAHSALALVQCRSLSDHEVLAHLIEVLVDSDKTVRSEAARAIGRMNRPEAALLLRLRALSGDEEPEVLGACFSALMSIEGRDGIPFVRRFLHPSGDVAGEAAMALGLMHEADALEALKERWEQESDPTFAGVLLSAMALSRLPEAEEFLLRLIETAAPAAPSAVEALASARVSSEVRARISAAVERSGGSRLRAVFNQHFS